MLVVASIRYSAVNSCTGIQAVLFGKEEAWDRMWHFYGWYIGVFDNLVM